MMPVEMYELKLEIYLNTMKKIILDITSQLGYNSVMEKIK